jgi:GH43 family beta-xylosidase
MASDDKMSRRALVAAGVALPVAAALPGEAAAKEAAIVNPLVLQRADPQILRHGKWFYFTASVPEYDRIVLRRARTIAGLRDAPETVIWRRPAGGKMAGYIWAPEIHHFDGRWHFYFAAGDGDDKFRIRTYVLQGKGANPLTAEWSPLGQLQTPWDTFTLDSTIFEHKGVRYLCWAQREPGIETNSNLYLAPLATPTTLAAAPARLTVPTLDWEIRGFKVAEGPAILARSGRLFLTYSASATDARYCMGMLTADADADIMNPASWSKSPVPVFATSEENKVFGPGHNSFVVDEKGRDLLVYHGRDYREIKGDPLFDPNRHARVQPVRYRADGTPEFGPPVANGPLRRGGS